MKIRARITSTLYVAVSVLLASISASLLLAPSTASARSRTIERDVPATGARALEVDVPAAIVRIRGVDAPDVSARLHATCGDDDEADDASCGAYLEGIDLRTEASGGRIRIELTGLRRHSGTDTDLTLTIDVPRRLAVELEVGAGDLEAADLRGDLRIKMGAGRAAIRVRRDAVGGVDASVGIGDASVIRDGRPVGTHPASTGFGDEIHWDRGSGRATIDVRVGVGEAEVRLD
ncbi:MAG: hypothetical protein ACM3JJ_04525 [Hyphomicrobiales bacterium]